MDEYIKALDRLVEASHDTVTACKIAEYHALEAIDQAERCTDILQGIIQKLPTIHNTLNATPMPKE